MNATTTYGTTWMGGDRPWFITDPTDHLVRIEGGGFVQCGTEAEAEAFARDLDAGVIRRDPKTGRVPAEAAR